MKTKTKALALALCAVLLVVATVFATMAFLTSTTEPVKNTFTVGKVEISLDEAKVDEYGNAVADAARVKENAYKLIPGRTYTKDPTVTVKAGSESSYIRMFVTITDYSDVKAVLGENFLPQNFVTDWNSSVWISTNVITEDETKNTATYEFRYNTTVSTVGTQDVALPALFKKIVMPGDVNGEDIKKLEELEINVVAQAIQADGFDGADDAWKAFDSQTSAN